MFGTLRNAWKIPDLKKRLLYTMMMLVIFRLGAAVPVPGIDKNALASLFTGDDGLLGFFNLMSGGAFKNFTIFALGISPYITASIIMNLLQIAIPQIEAMAKEGEEGRKKIARFTRYGTVVLALIQSFGISVGVFGRAFINPGPQSTAIAVLTLTAGTAFLMYLGEKINENGIGNGISMFIFAGILANIPFDIKRVLSRVLAGELSWLHLVLFFVIAIVIIAGVIFIQQGSRRVPVQYAKRVVGRKMYGGHSTHIPLKVNQAGVIPVIFSISILMMPITIAQFWPTGAAYGWLSRNFNQASALYNIINAVMIVGFTYFYTSVTFNPVDVSDNLKKNGGFIPGIRPGKPTTEYLERTLYRITFAGGVFLAIIATIPNVILALTNMKLSFGGTSILIAVGVSLETYKQIEAQITMRHYQGFLK